MSKKDNGFLDIESFHDKHWQNMPEFVQKDVEPFLTIQVKFRSLKDMQAFAKLTGLTVTQYMNGVWFPQNKHTDDGLKVYVDSKTHKIKEKKKGSRRTK